MRPTESLNVEQAQRLMLAWLDAPASAEQSSPNANLRLRRMAQELKYAIEKTSSADVRDLFAQAGIDLVSALGRRTKGVDQRIPVKAAPSCWYSSSPPSLLSGARMVTAAFRIWTFR